MDFKKLPLPTLRAYADGLRWHDPNLDGWRAVYEHLGIVRPLVVNRLSGHILSPPGEIEALAALCRAGAAAPAGVESLVDWFVPVAMIAADERDERRIALVLAGGVDRGLFTRPYDDSVINLLLDESEADINRVTTYGIGLEEFTEILEVLAAPDEPETDAETPISGNLGGDFWGVPLLDPAMQADRVYPAVKWGTVARNSRIEGGMYHFYTGDYKFRGLLHNPAMVLNSGAAAAVEINFSTAPNMARALVLHHIYQKRYIARRWQEAGIKVFVDLNVDREFFDLNLYGVPTGWRAWAVRAYARDLGHVRAAYKVACQHRGGDDVLFVVYGGGQKARALCERNGWSWLNEDADKVRGRYGARSSPSSLS